MSDNTVLFKETYLKLLKSIKNGQKIKEAMQEKIPQCAGHLDVEEQLVTCILNIDQETAWMRSAVKLFETMHPKLAKEYKKDL